MPEYISPQQLQVMLEQARGQIRGRGPGAAIQQRQNNQRMNQLQQAIQGNQRLQSGEMNSLIQSARQGGLQGPGNPSFQFQTPGAQEAYLEQIQNQQTRQQTLQDAARKRQHDIFMQGMRNQGALATANARLTDNPQLEEKWYANTIPLMDQKGQTRGALQTSDRGSTRILNTLGHPIEDTDAWAERGGFNIDDLFMADSAGYANVNFNLRQQLEEMQEKVRQSGLVGEETINMLSGMRDDADAAISDLAVLERLRTANETVRGGAVEPWFNSVKSILRSFGIRSESLVDYETFNSDVQSLNLNVIKEEGARGITEPELKIIADIFPSANLDPQARQQIIDVLTQAAQQRINTFVEEVNALPEGSPHRGMMSQRIRGYKAPTSSGGWSITPRNP